MEFKSFTKRGQEVSLLVCILWGSQGSLQQLEGINRGCGHCSRSLNGIPQYSRTLKVIESA
jgi:hypothetical protein